ncbi:DUF3859 domain-containing protein [Pseudooceanicola sp.]|jgi:hypothetical protein|uniref:DUF3859 domain-containing protein n=1 Tax=Pseudooceanicola sp. TaxID=1914328 RepID=UPI0035142673
MRPLAIIALVIAGPALGQTGNFVSPRVELLEFGIFCPDEPSGQVEAPDTERGFIDLIDGDPPVDFRTDVVPGELGLGFGMRFRLAGDEGLRMGRVIITHPPFGSPPIARESYAITLDGSATSMTQFDFDDPYEVQPGTWSMAVEIDGEIVLRQDFTVVPKEMSPISKKMCDGPDLLS